MIVQYILNNYETNQVYLFNNIYDCENLIKNCREDSRCYTNNDLYWFGILSDKLVTKFSYDNFYDSDKKVVVELYEDKKLKLCNELSDKRTVINNINVLILRDPLNWLASRIKHEEKYRSGKMKITNELLQLWIEYANEYMGYTNVMGNEKICINYVNFVVNEKYRRETCEKLKIKYFIPKTILPFNKGSSFSGLIMESPNMYINRYKLFLNNDVIQNVKNNGQIMSLAKKIFGDIY